MSRLENEEKKGRNDSPEKPGIKIEIDAAPKGEWKVLGGGDRDDWNQRLSALVVNALPVNQKNADTVSKAGSAVAAGMVDMKPADPIEGMRYLNWSWRMRPHCHCTSEPGLAIQLITLKRIHNISRLLTRPQEQ